MSLGVWTLMRDLGLSFGLGLAYFGLLALITRGLGLLPAKQAVVLTMISFPLRLGLLGLFMAWFIQSKGLRGALLLLVGLWAGRLLVHRLVRGRAGRLPETTPS